MAAMVDSRDAEIARLQAELREARADAQYFEGWATGNGHRLNQVKADRDRYRAAWQSARRGRHRAMGAWRYAEAGHRMWRKAASDVGESLRATWEALCDRRKERDRYRSAWKSARRRAEAWRQHYETEATARLDAEKYGRGPWVPMRTYLRLRAQLARESEYAAITDGPADTSDCPIGTLRKSTRGGWTLLGRTSDGADVYVAPVRTPAPEVS